MAYEYKIKIENIVNIVNKSNGSSTYVSTKPTDPQTPKKSVEQSVNDVTKKTSSFGDALSANLLLGSAKKLMGSIQNENIQKFNMQLSQTIKYGTLITRSLGQDYVAMITLCIELLAEGIKMIQSNAIKSATERNSVDEARYSAGILELNNVRVTKDWWSGRYTYSRSGGND